MARRMKLVTEAEYERLLTLRAKPVPRERDEVSFVEKELEATNLLQLTTLPDDMKLALYSSALKNINNKLTELQGKPTRVVLAPDEIKGSSSESQRVETSVVARDSPQRVETSAVAKDSTEKLFGLSRDDEFLVDALPEAVQPSARKIIQYLKSAPGLISWKSTGLCTIHGEVVDGSNLVDLLSYVLRPNLKIGNPIGAKRFLYVLRALDVPISILGHKRRANLKETLETLKRRQTERQNSDTSTSWQSFGDSPNTTTELD